ncbi:Long-chain fatty acid transport protein 4 [Armadillidium vulgare]|nr:Long-chain fatty acid transport protein 4 [Armadillidium vulgare]
MSSTYRALIKFIRMQLRIRYAQKNNLTIPKLFMRNVAKNPNKPALIFEGNHWTFAQVDEYSNRVADCLLKKGYKRGDNVALFMENRPEFVATWLGCAKIGIVTALINNNLRKVPLVHSIKIVNSVAVICGAELQQAVSDVFQDLAEIPVFVSGLKNENLALPEFENFDKLLSVSIPHANFGDRTWKTSQTNCSTFTHLAQQDFLRQLL